MSIINITTETASLAAKISLCAVIVYNHRLGRCKWRYNRSIKPAPEEALFISVQLSTDAVSALRKVWVLITLRASLSGTLLQTLRDLVTPLKGYSLSLRNCQRRGQRPPKGSSTSMTVEAT